MFLCDRGTLIKHWSLIRRFESWIYFEVYNIYFFLSLLLIAHANHWTLNMCACTNNLS